MSKHLQKLDAFGQVTESDNYVAIKAPFFNYDSLQLEWRIWDRNYIAIKNQADGEKKAAAVMLCGLPGRMPTQAEQLSIVDLTRCYPAINPIFNSPKSGWFRSSTVVVNEDGTPSGYAWYVYVSHGDSDWFSQDDGGFVRAVRASQ